MKIKYKIYTDGATSNNKKGEGIGGYAFVITKDNEELCSDYDNEKNTTNNICELKGLIFACQTMENILVNESEEALCEFYTDSAYIHNCYKDKWYKNWQLNGWENSKGLPVANRELWEQLIPFFHKEYFEFYKVKGHNGDKWNEYVDKLAVKAREESR